MTTKTLVTHKPKDLLSKMALLGFRVQTGARGDTLVKTCAVKVGSTKRDTTSPGI